MLERFIDWLLRTLLDLGYPGIIALMAMESSILPVPSELVMPPAGYWAAKGQMSFPVALICGVLGSIIGALANYFGAQLIGRPLLQRYGTWVVLALIPITLIVVLIYVRRWRRRRALPS